MLWLFLATLLNADASTVLIQSAESPSLEYRAMLKARGDYSSPTQEYLTKHPLVAEREQLLNRFAEAQKAFLEKPNDEARLKFTAVLDLLLGDDWDKGDREIFLQTYLRLAQMEVEAEPRDRWLGLSLLLGDVNYDSSLYPPPLMARRLEMAQQLPRKTLSKRLLIAGWSDVLINGHHCQKPDCGNWPLYPGKVRITALSDQWLPQSRVLDLTEFEQFSPPTIAWVEGRCGDSHLNAEAERFQSKKVFWTLECEKLSGPAVALNFKPVANAPADLPTFFAPAKSPPLYQSKWFWAGVGTVVAILVINSTQKKETKEPSTTYGY